MFVMMVTSHQKNHIVTQCIDATEGAGVGDLAPDGLCVHK